MANANKLKGMLYGLAIGDALGVPYEFRTYSPKIDYTGILHEADGVIQFRFCKTDVPAGTPSDDTRMSLALLDSIYKNNLHYSRDKTILSYLNWTGTEKMLGKNTRLLMKGVKTIKGYENRFKKLNPDDMESMQSNGSMMRISPMVFIEDETECLFAVKIDTGLTNPSIVNMYCNYFYVQLLRKIIYDSDETITKIEILDWISKWIQCNPNCSKIVTDAIKSGLNLEKRDVSVNKGHVINALYITVYAFTQYNSYQDAVDYIIGENPKSDTDTNAAICGAVFGAFLGFDGISEEEKTSQNIKLISDKEEIIQIENFFIEV